NPHRGPLPAFAMDPAQEVLEFHTRLPGYAPTPLIQAAENLWIKDESHRLGLPAFKMLGASWGTYHALRTRLGGRLQPWSTIEELQPGDIFASDADHRGEEGFARTVLAGYGTLLQEVARQLPHPPDVLFVQMGVGSLAAAMIANLGRLGWPTEVIGVEPADADCILESLKTDRLEFVPGPHRSLMVGLNCARPSDIAWPLLRAGLSTVVAIEDDWAERAMAELESLGIESGHSGAAGLAGLRALDGELRERSVLVINTEGATHLHA